MARYLSNAFSLNMGFGRFIAAVEPVSLAAARRLVQIKGVTNAIGHPDTDLVVRDLLGVTELSVGERMSLTLEAGDELIVAQYRGPRLPEGATALPEGAAIEFFFITFLPALGWDGSVSAYINSPLELYSSDEQALWAVDTATEQMCSVPPLYRKVGEGLVRAAFAVREAEESA